ncbi:tryptophan-rich sensory protein [Chitinophaga barathri]|uniref:Tryptophan-rich sensory protein n=1 Tax=Chitinophaga barathri TaxID=1647451 RepID=A0A3N4MS58_9BACT|nr:tryptophan-rich sensory protein [Chitinophaga barathri]RPD42970.1 tryptophan-rich sensory protein [Chitinophaga barathri]
MKKTLQILNGFALVITIVMNYVSNTGVFNGNTMASVSAEYQNLFTPAGYAFSIWGLIYLGMLGFVFYYGPLFKQTEEKEHTIMKIGWWFVVSCVANSLWVIAWLYHNILLSVGLIIVLLISLLKVVVNTNMELHNAPLKKFVFQWWPFCIYSGWVSVALIANIAAYLTKIRWDGFGISETTWTIIMLIIAALINIFIIWNRNMREFALVCVWALIAISVANKNGNELIFWVAIVATIVVFINIVIHGYQNRKRNQFIYKEKVF